MNFFNDAGKEFPTKIDVKLKDAAKKAERKLIERRIEGVYILQSNHVNGKPYWFQAEGLHALWYWYTKEKSYWMIGNKARLGSKFGRIHSKDSVGPLEATTWSYHDGVEWIETTDDLIILTGS